MKLSYSNHDTGIEALCILYSLEILTKTVCLQTMKNEILAKQI